jgi:hypothetical protein
MLLQGLVFTGELLEHLSHWKVFERVDELFILVPSELSLFLPASHIFLTCFHLSQ